MAERVEAGIVGYQEALMSAFPHERRLTSRLAAAVRRFSGSLYLTADHRRRMEALKARQSCRQKRDTPAYFAVMYLLTANEELFNRTANCFCKHGMEFSYAVLRNISPHNYTLFGAARDIYEDTSRIVLGDLTSSEIVDNVAFILIVNALLIARYGPAILRIKEKEAKT